MRVKSVNSRSQTLARLGVVAMLAGVAAGCSMDVSRFTDTIVTGSTKNQKQIVNAERQSPTYDELVTGSTAKPPAARGGRSDPGMKSSVSIYNPPEANAPISKDGWTTAGGTRISVRQGDSVSSMSRRYGVPKDAILAANPGLGNGESLAAGQQVIIPTYVHGGGSRSNVAAAPLPPQQTGNRSYDDIVTGSANQNAARPVGAQPFPSRASAPHPAPKPRRALVAQRPAAPRGGTHTVQAGETISSISRTYGISRGELIAANGLGDSNLIKIGQTLTIPAAGATNVARAAPARPDVVEAQPTRKPKARDQVATHNPDPDEVVTGSLPATEDKDQAGGQQPEPRQTAQIRSFRWPVRGRIISEFGSKPNGQHNDGINLAVPEGTSVKAAENGTVIYAGNELKGYGNLVLVRHSDGWVTAYAHNSELMVKRGESVNRGQIIAKAGASGTVTQPQLHFELRKGSRPVDPMPYLAGA